MAFIATVASFFSIPVILSLMGKKRPSTDEPGPSQERRGKKKADQKGKAIAEVQTKRRNDPRPPVKDMGNFLVRPVAYEASVEEHLIGEFAVLGRLMKKNWGPMFYGDSPADDGRARAFYVRIRNPKFKPLGFDLVAGGKTFSIGVAEIAGVLGVPQGEVQIDEGVLDTSLARDERTRFLCGQVAQWKQGERGQGLSSSKLLPGYRVLHRICTYNVYPRLINRAECSRYMVEFLYQVGRGADVCLPSVVLHQIVRAARATRKSVCLPFGRLVCQLAVEYGICGSDGNNVPTQLLGDDMLNSLKVGPNQRQAPIEQYGDPVEEDEGSEKGEEGEDEDENGSEGGAEGAEQIQEAEEVGSGMPVTPDVLGRLGALDSRMARIEETQARIQENQAKQEEWNKKMYRAIKALICCSKGEEAPPLSPDSDE